MERLIVGNDTDTKGWCVCRVNNESFGKDADVEIVELAESKEDAWSKAWQRNYEYGGHERIYIALCKIDLERG